MLAVKLGFRIRHGGFAQVRCWFLITAEFIGTPVYKAIHLAEDGLGHHLLLGVAGERALVVEPPAALDGAYGVLRVRVLGGERAGQDVDDDAGV